MSELAITAEGLSKSYRIGRGSSLLSALGRAVGRPGAAAAGEDSSTHWALRDVSFQIAPGEVVGIIGRNGAGKSTLLKILSRITLPSAGRAVIRGRVSSLLEVGTGFHPELTGRENIYMNGAILGMRRAELAARFDRIVDFSGVERFLDTPLKRYSSGMQVRLAFAVAAHLEPEVLIVDEVLAVGDAEFQRKCMGRMSEVARGGRTVLFVSHNLAAVQNLCSRGILLAGGKVQFDGPVDDALRSYVEALAPADEGGLYDIPRRGNGALRVRSLRLRDGTGQVVLAARTGDDLELHLEYEITRPIRNADLTVRLQIRDRHEVPITLHHSRLTGEAFAGVPERGSFVLKVPRFPIAPGSYPLSYSIWEDGECLDAMQTASALVVTEGDYYGTGRTPLANEALVFLDGTWRVEPLAGDRSTP